MMRRIYLQKQILIILILTLQNGLQNTIIRVNMYILTSYYFLSNLQKKLYDNVYLFSFLFDNIQIKILEKFSFDLSINI